MGRFNLFGIPLKKKKKKKKKEKQNKIKETYFEKTRPILQCFSWVYRVYKLVYLYGL